MAIEKYVLHVHDFSIDVTRKNIKNLHLGVYPPSGDIRVSAPIHLSEERIKIAIISRVNWIYKQKEKFINQQRESHKVMLTGESHYFLGDRYLLNVEKITSRPYVKIRNKSIIDIFVKDIHSCRDRMKVLEHWYRGELKKIIEEYIEKWVNRLNLSTPKYYIRKMKTKWGSCNSQKSSIVLNLELIKKPLQCIEYVVLHELIHFLEYKHNDKFIAHLNRYYPQWKFAKDELNQLPL